MKVLVTGGAGFIGSALVRRLSARGHHAVVLDDFSRGKLDNLVSDWSGMTRWGPTRHGLSGRDKASLLSGVTLLEGDIRDWDTVLKGVKQCEIVWHGAYPQGTQSFYEEPRRVIDVALGGILNVLRACAFVGNRELILVSSSEAYQIPPEGYFPTAENVPLSVPDPRNPRYSYGGGKIASEIASFAYADQLKRLVIVRPHNVYGPSMGREHVIPEFADRMTKITNGARDASEPENFKIQGTGQETRSFCYIDDCIDGLMMLLEAGEHRGIYHLGNDSQEFSIEKLAHAMAHWYSDQIQAEGGPEFRIKVVPGKLPEGSPPRRLPDITRLCELGYHPRFDLYEGLDRTLRWYRANAMEPRVAA